MARDRLAAARAHQGATSQNQQQQSSYPQQSQQAQYGGYDPYAQSEDPRSTRSRSVENVDRAGGPRDASAGGPYDMRQPRSSSGGRGHSRRPSNPPPINAPPPTPPVVFGRAYGGPEQAEPKDFNPNMTTQYVPGPPAVTRQRSLSGGHRTSEDRGRPFSITEPYPDLPSPSSSQPHHQVVYTRGPAPGRKPSAALPAPPYQEDPYARSEKASTVDLVEAREQEGRQGSSGSGKTKKPQGGPTIKAGDVPHEEMGQFFMQISDLQQALRQSMEEIQAIQSLHMRLLSLPSVDDPQAVMVSERLTSMSQSTRSFFVAIKDQIHSLEQGNANLRALIPAGQSVHNLTLADVDVRTTQVNALKERFKAAIQAFAEVERESRAKNRARMERQVKVVNPQMSPEDIHEIVKQAEEGGANMFSQALLSSGKQRSNAARGALREVETRAAELARIEQTLVQLAQLFNDMALMVEAQDVQIIKVEENAVEASTQMEQGVKEVKSAVVHARSARKMRWICCGIITVVLLIVLIVVLVEVVVPIIKRNNDNKARVAASVAATSTAILSSTVVVTATSTAIASITSAPVA